MKRLLLFLVLMLAVIACDEEEFSTLIITAQVAKTLAPASNTASILLGRATVANLLNEDWMETPDPGDTNFGGDIFPAKVTPVSNATVTLGTTAVSMKLPGVYFKSGLDLQYLSRYDLSIQTEDGKTATAHGFLPDSFTLVTPLAGDTLNVLTDTLRAIWTRSDSAQSYVISVTPADSSSTARGWSKAVTDTFYSFPVAAFSDSLGNIVPGNYFIGVTAVNGGWNKAGLDLFLSGGNVAGGLGVFGCAVCPAPVLLTVR